MRQRLTLLVAMLVLAATIPAGVAGATAQTQQDDCSFPYTVTDASGTEITLDERPDRITTLNPSAAQTVWELGGREQVVGVTANADYLDGFETKTSVSATDGFGVSVERVVGTEPDLVLAPNASQTETVRALRDAGVTVYQFAAAETLEDVTEKTTQIARLTGHCEAAVEVNAWMEANVEAARTATADVERPRVLYPLGSGYVANTNTFISAMIEASGGTNVLAEFDYETDYPQVSDEIILQANPEMLVVNSRLANIYTEEPYASTTAGQNNATVVVNTDYLNQPAPRSVVFAVRNLTEGFHPDVDASFVARSDVTVATATPTTTATATDTPAATASTDSTETTAGEQPGFGVVAALLAVGALVLARRE
ncbi:PGF-CTERM-anchored ABC transporter substrate-binding protein [Halosegnis longus]|uniref:Corrinoid ABC transporter substrate-binding protein n=1 Tax=Halosegnis longus TaxID=2216012 RepID=A0AAJ4UWG7_9EURY|nr:PGF-CTERM-anchored ABC transporter substrate-binding protein [Halosegnis longus]RNJ26900.1 corrinoid ABC transporter substrate-binding protein [Salella cibi]